MPYIKQHRRDRIDFHNEPPCTPGELNYAITQLLLYYIDERGGTSYSNINEVVGALECAKMELYRRCAAPYEDQKRFENGDVYERG